MKRLKIETECCVCIKTGWDTFLDNRQKQAIEYRNTREVLCEWEEPDGTAFLSHRITSDFTSGVVLTYEGM